MTSNSVRISAPRRVETPSRHRRDSCPSHNEVGGFFVDFGPIRTASGPSRRVGEDAVTSMASSRCRTASTPSTWPSESLRVTPSFGTGREPSTSDGADVPGLRHDGIPRK